MNPTIFRLSRLASVAAIISCVQSTRGADIEWDGATADWFAGTNWAGGNAPSVGDTALIGTATGVTGSVLDLGGATTAALSGSSPSAPAGTGLSGSNTAALHFGSAGGITNYTIQNGTVSMGSGEALLWIDDGITVDWNVNSSGVGTSQARFWQVGGGSTLNIGAGSTHNSRFTLFNGGASGSTATVNLAAANFDTAQPWIVGSGNASTVSTSRVSRNLTLNVNADQALTSTLQVGYAFVGFKSKVVVRNGAVLSSTNTVALGESRGSSGQGILQVGDGTTTGIFTTSGTNRLRLGTGTSGGGSEGVLDIVNGTANLNDASSVSLSYAGVGGSKGTINVGANGVLNTRSNFALQSGADAGSGTINFDGGRLQVDTGSSNAQRSNLIDSSVVVNIENGGMVFNTNNKSDTVINAALLNAGGTSTGGLQVRDLGGGTGKLTITGTNTYAGETNIRDTATLILGASASIADSAGVRSSSGATIDVSAVSGFTLGSGQYLTGSGTVAGAITVAGIVAPNGGSGITGSIATLAADSGLTWNSSLVDEWAFDLGTAGADLANAGNSDLLDILGDFTMGTGSDFTFDFQGGGEEGYYKLVDWTGTTGFSDTDFSATNLAGGLTGSFIVDGGTSALYLNVVPEPSSMLLGLFGGMVLLGHRKRS